MDDPDHATHYSGAFRNCFFNGFSSKSLGSYYTGIYYPQRMPLDLYHQKELERKAKIFRIISPG